MNLVVTATEAGQRLDRYLTAQLTGVTRAQIHRWIDEGHVVVGGMARKPAYLVHAGDAIEVSPPEAVPLDALPESLPLDILYEDHELIVVNKAAGMVVHPGAGQSSGTLVNALLGHCQDLSGIGDRLRPGIVHRLDKGTSGVLVAAKTQLAHHHLVNQFQARTVEKMYCAIVMGRIAPEGTVTAAIGRHPQDRKRMSVRARRGRAAVTTWRVTEYFGDLGAWLEIRIGTGRTHQIRVHLSSEGHPLIGDATYGGVSGLRRFPDAWREALQVFPRPALHAWRLGFTHPTTGQPMHFEAPVPADLLWLRDQCRMLVTSCHCEAPTGPRQSREPK